MGTTAYEAAYHIGQVRLRGGLPSTDARFTDAKLLKLLTDELQGHVAPLVHNAKSDHGVIQYTVAATVGTAAYAMPPTAFANTLRDVYWIDASSASDITPLHPRSAADPLMYALTNNNGTPKYYYLRGSRVHVVPPPATAGTLAMPHYARPSNLATINSTLGGTITSVSLVNGDVDVRLVVDVGSIANGAAFTTAATGNPLDVIDRRPSFEALGSNLIPDSVVDNLNGTVRVQHPVASFASLPAVGDYVYLAGNSPVPQCPVELFPLLHARAALVAVPSTGDMSQAAGALSAQVADLEAKAVAFLRPRVESAQPPPGRGMGSNAMLDTLSGSWTTF